MKKHLPLVFTYLALWQAMIAALGSLFFSEIMKFPPCVLCWYQRIAMYPLVMILAVGIARRDKKIYWYVLPLSLMGLVISAYHNLLYYELLPKSIEPCQSGVSCTTRFFAWYGVITIPLLSFIAFIVVSACMLSLIWVTRENSLEEKLIVVEKKQTFTRKKKSTKRSL